MREPMGRIWRFWWYWGVVLLGGVCLVTSVAGHVTGLSTSQVVVQGTRVTSTLLLPAHDLERALGMALVERSTGEIMPERLARHATAVVRYIQKRIVVSRAGIPCPFVATAPQADADKVRLVFSWTCPTGYADIALRVTLFQERDAAARHLVRLRGPQGEAQILLNAQTPEVRLVPGAVGFLTTVRQFISAGIEHIFLGIDHLAFLLAVILWGRRLLPLIKVVTAFTIAHSLTLSLAVLNLVHLPSTFVEGAIAASIVYVALENFFIREIGRRWRITFLFGLVHGFGFSSVLREMGLPDNAVVTALASFNIGVEIGQSVIVAAVVLILMACSRLWNKAGHGFMLPSPVVYAVSGLISLAGLYWLVERVFIG